MKVLNVLFLVLCLSACGSESSISRMENPMNNPTPIGVPGEDGAVVHGRATYEVVSEQETLAMKMFHSVFPYAYAASGTSTVTYNNVASTSFAISVVNLGAGAFTGDILSLGNVALSNLDDNNLKVCGVGGNQKCNAAAIRVYTMGSVAGFVNTADGYGAPLHAGSLNPNVPVGLTTTNSVQVQNISVAANKNRLRLSDFVSPTYSVSSDFSNAGAGSYSMTFVVEYVLLP